MKDYNNELLNDCAWFAEKHRGKNKQSGAHWSTIIRFAPLFDEAVRLQKENNKLKVQLAASESATVLHELSEMLKNTQARVQELEQKQRWISVEEWQPKQCGFYVYEDFRSRLDVDYFHTEKPDLSEVNRLFSMPIPQPPESEEE